MVTVKKVITGDHFMALRDDSRDEIRCILWGVEAQKTKGAKEYLDQMIGGKRVQVEWKDPVFKQTRSDVHGSGSSRVPTYYLVEVKIKADKQWIFVGPEMLRQGCAKCRDDELKGALDGPYRIAQKYAKENRIGLWAIPGYDGEGTEGDGGGGVATDPKPAP